MHCLNCGTTDAFVLVVELTVRVRPPDSFVDPDWALGLECAACASTDVEGDPLEPLAARAG